MAINLRFFILILLGFSSLVACKLQPADRTAPLSPAAPRTSSAGGLSLTGGADTGGGNGERSTPEQIYQTLHEIKRRILPVAFYRVHKLMEAPVAQGLFESNESIPPELQGVLEDMLKGNSYNSAPIYEDVKTVEYRLLQNGPCLDREGNPHDASEQEDGKICFSLERLQRIPFNTLEKELLALATHEHVHRYNYWDEAILVQKFFLGVEPYDDFKSFVNLDTDVLARISSEVQRLYLSAQELDSMLNEADRPLKENIIAVNTKRPDQPPTVLNADVPDNLICSHVGRVSGLMSNLFGAGDGDEMNAKGRGLWMHPNYWVYAGMISQTIAGTFSFCGFEVHSGYGLRSTQQLVDGEFYAPVAEGNRQELAQVAHQLSERARAFHEDLFDYFYGAHIHIGKVPPDLSHTLILDPGTN